MPSSRRAMASQEIEVGSRGDASSRPSIETEPSEDPSESPSHVSPTLVVPEELREAHVSSVLPPTPSDQEVRRVAQILIQLVASQVRRRPRASDSDRPLEGLGSSQPWEFIGHGPSIFTGFNPDEGDEQDKRAMIVGDYRGLPSSGELQLYGH